MIVELKKGYTIESKYDKFSDSYITRLLDNESKQVGEPLSSKDIVGKNQDIKSAKDYFNNYVNNKRVEDEIPDDLDFVEPEEDSQTLGDVIADEDLFEESLSLKESLKKATAYLLRADGQVFECTSAHPYLKENSFETVDEFFFGSAYEITLNMLHESSLDKNFILGVESLVKSFLKAHPDIKSEFDKYIEFDYSKGKVYPESQLNDLYDYLNNKSNQEFCRVRTSDMYSGGDSKDIYIRISSDNFDWSDVIYKFIISNNKSIDTVTIDKDKKSDNRPITYVHKGQSINHMPIKEFLSLNGLVLESYTEDELKRKVKKTKKATRKSKLPALSTLSPIMPDYAKGIDAFNAMQADGNSSMGSTTGSISLGEEFKDRDALVHELKKMGFKYKFDKYSDKQLFRIYQERLKTLKKREEAKKAKQRAYQGKENKRENAKDSYFKNGIEFESEDAAREYFGEQMENKIYLNDLHEAWDIVEDEVKTSLNESVNKNGHNFKNLTEGFHYFEAKHFNEKCEDAQLEVMYESVRDKLSSDDIKKLGAFMNHAQDPDEVVTYMKGLLSEDLDDSIDKDDFDNLWEEMFDAFYDATEAEVSVPEGMYGLNQDPFNKGGYIFAFQVKGESKDHRELDEVAKSVAEYNGFEITEMGDEVISSPNGSTYYESYHIYKVKYTGIGRPENESLKEDYGEAESNTNLDYLLSELSSIGFVVDEKYPIRDGLFGRKHIQIINPDLVTSEETFRDDIQPLIDVLDKVEETLGRDAGMTYNIGANDNLQVTAGVDLK